MIVLRIGISEPLKARLHMRFLMRFLVRFRIQNVPYPTLHEYFFREALRGLERKLSHIISRHPSFQFLLNWRYSVAELRDYKPVRGRLWQILFTKSHQNRMYKRAFRIISKMYCCCCTSNTMWHHTLTSFTKKDLDEDIAPGCKYWKKIASLAFEKQGLVFGMSKKCIWPHEYH